MRFAGCKRVGSHAQCYSDRGTFPAASFLPRLPRRAPAFPRWSTILLGVLVGRSWTSGPLLRHGETAERVPLQPVFCRREAIMRIRPGSFLLLSFLMFFLLFVSTRAGDLRAQDPAQQNQDQSQSPDQNQDQDQSVYANFTPDQLDNLLAPIALYPDPVLAQVLVAATFPDQIDEASRFLRAGANPGAIDDQPWDVSVKAVAHYPTVLYMMDNRLDWTTSIGQAYVNQSTDVQASIQRLRGMAHDAGTLQSGPQMDVENQDGYWDIWPVEPQMIYVPVYDPAILYIGRRGWIGP